MKLILNTKRIHNELARLNKNQNWLAKELGTSRQNVHRILRNKPITQADKIANVFGCEAKDLITYE